jgi:two-component system sensor histidine kinase VicK
MNIDDDNVEVLKLLMRGAREVFFVFDADQLRFTYVNEAFHTITKRESKELLDHPKHLLKIIHKEDIDYVRQSFKVLLKNSTRSVLDFRICRPDKIERWMRVRIYPVVKGGKVEYLTGIAEDDSARKASIFNMQKVNGWKDANLEILSHDLRGPIGTVRMLSSVIGKKMPDNKDIQKMTQLIEEISKRNISLIQSLLSREALDTANVEISKERLDVVWEVHQAMDIYIDSQNDLNKHITYTYSDDHIYADLDSMKFLQIVNNLVSNAIKFTGDKGHIKVHIEQLENTFLITVVDDGIGIPKKLRPILFNKYTRAGRSGLEGEESVGLGMWIVKTLTEAHNGKVWFESEPKEGSKFYVEIPLGFPKY